jgi:hypothetical protein
MANCLGCSIPLPPGRPKYCSRKCTTRMWSRKHTSYTAPLPRNCENCRKVFTPPIWHPKSRSCSKKCSKRLQYRSHREEYISRVTKWAGKNRDKVNANYRRYSKNNPLQASARSKVGYALKKGELVRPDRCSKCGKVCKPEAHHPDYSKPLEVEWLCKPCHVAVLQ